MSTRVESRSRKRAVAKRPAQDDFIKLNCLNKYCRHVVLLITLLFLMIIPVSVDATKCHSCFFLLSHCNNPLDCYNQPDTCSNTNFSPVNSPVVECEFGCEQYVVTDATGSIVGWRRGCANERSPKSSYICFSRNLYFLRHEQCWCHTDYCNSSNRLGFNTSLVVVITLIVTFLLLRY